MTFEPLKNGFLKRIRVARDKLDKKVKKALDKNDSKYKELKDRLIHFKKCIYIPKDDTLWEDITREHHDSTLERHLD